MKTFILNMQDLPGQIFLLESMLKDYSIYLKEQGKSIKNFDLNAEISAVKNFIDNFEKTIEKAIKKNGKFSKDIFKNEYKKPYNFIQITPSGDRKFGIIRFVGNEGSGTKRYYLSDIQHTFSPTTMNFISQIKEMVNPLYNIKNAVSIASCAKVENNWDEISKKMFVPPPIVTIDGNMNDEKLEALRAELTTPYMTKEQLDDRNSKIFFEKQAIFKKALKDTDSSLDVSKLILENVKYLRNLSDCRKTLNEIGKYIDRFSFASILSEALTNVLPANFTFEDSLRLLNLNQILDRLSIIFPKDSTVFGELIDLFNNVLFGSFPNLADINLRLNNAYLEFEDLNNCLPELQAQGQNTSFADERMGILIGEISSLSSLYETTKQDIFDSLGLSPRQRALFSDLDFNLIDIVSNVKTDEEKLALDKARDRILNEINKFIPLSEIGFKVQDLMVGNFDLTKFKIPFTRPLNDPFQGFSEQILEVFFQTTCEGILIFVEAFINEALKKSNNFDNVISSIVGNKNSNFADISKSDFSLSPSDVGSSNFSSFAGSNDSNLQQQSKSLGISEGLIKLFGDSAKDAIKGIASQVADTYGSDIGEMTKSTNDLEQAIFDYSSVKEFSGLFNSFEVDPFGEKFVTSDGLVEIDTVDLDIALTKNIEEAVRYMPACSINPDLITNILNKIGEIFDSRANENDNSLNSSQADDQNNDAIRDDITKLLDNFIACATPTELVKALGGDVSDETCDLIKNIIDNTTPNLKGPINNPDKIRDLCGKIGIASGLSELLPALEILTSRPENKKRIVSPKLCEPFNNIDNFRKALMVKAVPPDLADEILKNINNEKVKKYNELTNAVLAMTGGEIPEPLGANPNRKLIDDLNRNIFNPAIKDAAAPPPAAGVSPQTGAPPALSGQDGAASPEDEEEFPKSMEDLLRDEMKKKAEQSPIYLSMLETTLLAVFGPVREAFDKAMLGYIDSISETKTVESEIPRKKTYKVKDPKTGQQQNITVVNPEFKDFLKQGLVPILEKDSDKYAKMVPKNQIALTQGIKPLEILSDAPFIGDFAANFALGAGETTWKITHNGKESGDIKAWANGSEDSDYTKLRWSLGVFIWQFFKWINNEKPFAGKKPSDLGWEGGKRDQSINPRDPLKKPIQKLDKEKSIDGPFVEGMEIAFSPSSFKIELKEDLFKISISEYKAKGGVFGELDKNLALIGEGGISDFLNDNKGSKPGVQKGPLIDTVNKNLNKTNTQAKPKPQLPSPKRPPGKFKK